MFGAILASLVLTTAGRLQVIVDQDCSGPATTNTNSLMLLLQSPDVDVLGITVSSGDGWVAESVLHCLRLLEILGRSDVPVIGGAAVPWDQSPQSVTRWEAMYGILTWKGSFGLNYSAFEVFPEHFPEGIPTTAPSPLSAANFIVDTVRAHPPESISLVALGPMSNIATALVLDPELPALVKELWVGGGAIDCGHFEADPAVLGLHCDDPDRPKHEFNIWYDAASAHRVFTSQTRVQPPWNSLVILPVDMSSQAMWTPTLVQRIEANSTGTRAAEYLATYLIEPRSIDLQFPLFDEMAVVALVYPDIIVSPPTLLYVDVDYSQGPGHGNLLTWRDESRRPQLGEQQAKVYLGVSLEKFYDRVFQLVFARD